MFRIFAPILALTVFSVSVGLESIYAQSGTSAQSVGIVRAKVQKLGVGQKAKVSVKMRDNTKLKGYISAAGEDSFTVTDAKNGSAQTLAYTDVVEVKKQGGGLSPLTLGIIAAAAVTAIIVGVTVIKPVVCDGGAGC